jgi:hypothetical protein
MRELNRDLMAYIWHLPVTTEIARDLGIEVADYPKFLADIEFTSKNGWLSWHLSEGGRDILTLGVRKLDTKPRGHSRVYPITLPHGVTSRLIRAVSSRTPRQQWGRSSGDFGWRCRGW